MRWRLLADLLVALHLAAFALVLAGPWLPWWVHSNALIAPLWGLASNRGRCRITQWEFTLRKRLDPEIKPVGLIRRLWYWAWREDITEGGATVLLILAMSGSLWLRWYLRGLSGFLQ